MSSGKSTKGGQNQAEMHENYSLSTGFIRSGQAFSEITDERFCYQNAASCPDCEGGMVKQGGCFTCPGCGFSTCSA